MHRCYIASPLGFTEPGRHYYREVYLPALAKVVEVVDPWSLTSEAQVRSATAEGRLEQLNASIGARNIDAIRSCTLLAAQLDGQEPDSGTVAELAYAAGIGLRCFGLRSDLRQSGEPGSPVNLQVQAFISISGGTLVATLDELVEVLAAQPTSGSSEPGPEVK